MNSNVKRYIVNIDGTNRKSEIDIAFKTAINLCLEDNIGLITILVPMKSGFENKAIGQYLEAPTANVLKKGNKIALQEQPSLIMELESAHTMSEHKEYGVILAMQLSPKHMHKLEDIFSAKAIIYLPWMILEQAEWDILYDPTWIEVP